MTGAERMERYGNDTRSKLARKAARRGGHTAPTEESVADMIPTWESLSTQFVGPDEVKP